MLPRVITWGLEVECGWPVRARIVYNKINLCLWRSCDNIISVLGMVLLDLNKISTSTLWENSTILPSCRPFAMWRSVHPVMIHVGAWQSAGAHWRASTCALSLVGEASDWGCWVVIVYIVIVYICLSRPWSGSKSDDHHFTLLWQII